MTFSFIDDFLPMHNLDSLEDLASHLRRLTAGKRPFAHHQPGLHKAAFVGQR